MSWRLILLVAVLAAPMISGGSVEADPPFRYPRVFGWTGRPYGPTVAFDRYRAQYGVAWHGYGGIPVSRRSNSMCWWNPGGLTSSYYHSWNSWPGLTGGYLYTGSTLWGGDILSNIYAPQLYQSYVFGPSFQFQLPTNTGLPAALPDWNASPLPPRMNWIAPPVAREERRLQPSTAAARHRSLEHVFRGDDDFRQQKIHLAYLDYKAAIREAHDEARPHFRMAFALASMGRYERAVEHLRLGLQRDPEWPLTGESLTTIYGLDNIAALNVDLQQIAAWTRSEPRHPDRLFLLGVFLYFNEQADDAAVCFETALLVGGDDPHLRQFLSAAQDPLPSDAAEPNQTDPDAGPVIPEPNSSPEPN